MEGLKPCPFCGAIPRLKIERTSETTWYVLEIAHKNDCFFIGMGGGGMVTKVSAFNHSAAIRQWNKRWR